MVLLSCRLSNRDFPFASMLFGAKHPAAQSSAQTGCWCSGNFVTLEPAPSPPKRISFALNVRATDPLTDQPWVCVNSIAGDRLILLDRMSRRYMCCRVGWFPPWVTAGLALVTFEKSFELARFVEQQERSLPMTQRRLRVDAQEIILRNDRRTHPENQISR